MTSLYRTFYGENIDHDFAIVADKNDIAFPLANALWGAKTDVIYPN